MDRLRSTASLAVDRRPASRHRPAARGGPTIHETFVRLAEPSCIVGPPLAGGLLLAHAVSWLLLAHTVSWLLLALPASWLLLALPASWLLHKLDHILFRKHYLGYLVACLFAHINLAAPGDEFALACHGPRGTPSFPLRAGGGDAEEQF